ncbi:MAG: outer membrane homotrimeric porin, partial [Deltaproteobacteria bacterium]|nr:outer membrane homotrimeric porin [Deltaproteobacteria bacterium]
MPPGGTTAAQAIDFKPSGGFEFAGTWGNVTGDKGTPHSGLQGGTGSSKNHSFGQRFRLYLDVVASESLRGFFGFENNVQWGKNSQVAGNGLVGRASGGGIGTRGTDFEILWAYVDWIPPHTDLRIRMGLQPAANPGFVQGGSNVVGAEHMAGITTSYQFTPNVGSVLAWYRPYADNLGYTASNGNATANRTFSDVDAFLLAIPLSFDGVKVTPWGMYAAVGRDAHAGYSGRAQGDWPGYTVPVWFSKATTLAALGVPAGATVSTSDGQGSAWWLGLTDELTLWNPFRLAWDFNYGSADLGKVTVNGNKTAMKAKRQGWLLNVLAEYKLDFMTPGLAFWYTSGDGRNWEKGSKMMPAVRPTNKMTSFGFDTTSWIFPAAAIGQGIQGTWGIMAQLKDLTFVQDLK